MSWSWKERDKIMSDRILLKRVNGLPEYLLEELSRRESTKNRDWLDGYRTALSDLCDHLGAEYFDCHELTIATFGAPATECLARLRERSPRTRGRRAKVAE